MFVDDELFFPIGTFCIINSEEDLTTITQNHINYLLLESPKKKIMDLIYTSQKGKLKIIYTYNISHISHLDLDTCSGLKEQENHKKLLDDVNELKNHPALLSWKMQDERNYCFNNLFWNRTLTINKLDPNHPTYSVLIINEINQLINYTDIFGVFCYPIGGNESRIRSVHHFYTYNPFTVFKSAIGIAQIFDWSVYKKWQPDFKPALTTLQEMKHMSWQYIAASKRIRILFF